MFIHCSPMGTYGEHRMSTCLSVDGAEWMGWGMLVDTSLIGHLARSSCVCVLVCLVCFGHGHCRIRYIRHFIYSLGI